jgi:hypothetical protein
LVVPAAQPVPTKGEAIEFVQLIEFTTSKMEEIQELDRQSEKATEGSEHSPRNKRR